jgi:hypothetical protein
MEEKENSNIKKAIDLISLHKNEIIKLKSPKERAEKLLDLFEKHIEKCKNISVSIAISGTKEMINAMNDIELLNDIPVPMFYLRGYLNDVSIEGGGEAIEKIKELLNYNATNNN